MTLVPLHLCAYTYSNWREDYSSFVSVVVIQRNEPSEATFKIDPLVVDCCSLLSTQREPYDIALLAADFPLFPF